MGQREERVEKGSWQKLSEVIPGLEEGGQNEGGEIRLSLVQSVLTRLIYRSSKNKEIKEGV